MSCPAKEWTTSMSTSSFFLMLQQRAKESQLHEMRGPAAIYWALANERDKLILNAGMLYELDIESVQ